MSKLTLGDLPEVFVPFETVKAKRGKIIYYNKDLGVTLSASELMSKYNYITIDTALESDNFLDRKVFLQNDMAVMGFPPMVAEDAVVSMGYFN